MMNHPWTTRTRRTARALVALAGAFAVAYAVVELVPSRGVVVGGSPRGPQHQDAAPEFAQAFSQGIAAFRQGDAHGAMIAFERAAQLQPASSAALVNLGFALVELRAFDQARARFERALHVNPEQFNAYYGIAEVLEAQGQIQQAAGAMKTFLHYADESDPFRRRAQAALWEWDAADFAQDDTAAARVAKPGSVYGLAARDLDGAEQTLDAYRGKIVVLNIWASWCPPCRRELPELDRLARQVGDKDIAVVGLSVDGNRDYVREYLRRIGVDFTNLWDENGAVTRRFFQVDAYPTTFLIAPEGRVAAKIVGYRDWTSDAMVRRISALN